MSNKMRALSSPKLTLLSIIVGHLGLLCDALPFRRGGCGPYGGRFGHMHDWHCNRSPEPMIHPCHEIGSLCSEFPDFHDCLLPQFQCFGNRRCIPRSRYCDGMMDCDDGSDEWGCHSQRPASVDRTSSNTVTTSTMLLYNEEKTTSKIISESEENTSASYTTISAMLPHSESNTVLSSSTTSTMFPDPESNTVLSSSTTTSTMLPDSELKTSLSSTTSSSTMLPDSESSTAFASALTTKTMLPDSEASTSLPSFAPDNTIVPDLEEKTSSLTTNMILPGSSALQSCPDNYCMQNAKCIVVQGQYRCKCPSSFIGEQCEIKLRTPQVSHEYAVAIVIFTTLIILCVSVVSMCIYRYKRISALKSNDMTSRTLSQLTLTANAIY